MTTDNFHIEQLDVLSSAIRDARCIKPGPNSTATSCHPVLLSAATSIAEKTGYARADKQQALANAAMRLLLEAAATSFTP